MSSVHKDSLIERVWPLWVILFGIGFLSLLVGFHPTW